MLPSRASVLCASKGAAPPSAYAQHNSHHQPTHQTFPLYASSLRVMPKNPILLCHGLLGVAGILGPNYFRGVREKFSMLGVKDVFATKVSRTGGILVRAGELGAEVERYRIKLLQSRRTSGSHELEDIKFNVIGHSMGGLDARYLVSHLAGAKHIASITTIGTPHHGSHIADLAMKITDFAKLEPFFKYANMPLEGYRNITKEAMRKFNATSPDHPDVKYFSYAGDGAATLPLHPLFVTHRIIAPVDGANDGLVAVEHQRWGEHIRTLPMNHLEEINWYLYPTKFDALTDLYVDILRLLGDRGL